MSSLHPASCASLEVLHRLGAILESLVPLPLRVHIRLLKTAHSDPELENARFVKDVVQFVILLLHPLETDVASSIAETEHPVTSVLSHSSVRSS